MTRQEEKTARETIGYKVAQLKIVMANDVMANAKLKEAIGKSLISKDVRKALNKCQYVMSKLDEGMAHIQWVLESGVLTETSGRRLAQSLQASTKGLANMLHRAKAIGFMLEDDSPPAGSGTSMDASSSRSGTHNYDTRSRQPMKKPSRVS